MSSRLLPLSARAVAIDPLDCRAHLCRCWSYAMAGQHQAGLAHLDLAMDLNENDPWTIISAALSFALLAAIAYQVRNLNLVTVGRLVPDSLSFWGVFLAYFMVGPIVEWVIFRRLWDIPSSGIIIPARMIGKMILRPGAARMVSP